MLRPLFLPAILLGAAVATAQAQHQAPTLYQRLGGYDAIAAVTDAFIVRLVQHSELAPFFRGHGLDSQKRLRRLVVDQLCAVTGGPCVYQGRDMKTAHAGLGITAAQWTAAVDALVMTLQQFKVPMREQDELLKLVGPLESQIVERK